MAGFFFGQTMSIIQDEFDAQLGIRTKVHRTDDRLVIEKEWDASPLLETAAAARAMTEGDRWGEMRHVGFIPMAELAKFMRQDGGFDHSRCMAWLKQNPAFVTFSKVLK